MCRPHTEFNETGAWVSITIMKKNTNKKKKKKKITQKTKVSIEQKWSSSLMVYYTVVNYSLFYFSICSFLNFFEYSKQSQDEHCCFLSYDTFDFSSEVN